MNAYLTNFSYIFKEFKKELLLLFFFNLLKNTIGG